jgi:hypothetical protein
MYEPDDLQSDHSIVATILRSEKRRWSTMLQSHRDTLQNFIVTTSRDIPSEMLSSRIGQALGICLQILQDAVSVLNSLIEYLDQPKDEDRP